MFNLSPEQINKLIESLVDTLYLLGITSVFLIVIGLTLGIVLYITSNELLYRKNKPKSIIHKIIGVIVDVFRSIPFIILMILLIPFTIKITGTMTGRNAALPALIISASPFYARVVYNALNEVSKGKVLALLSMGARVRTIVKYVIKEALPSLIKGLTIALVTLVGFISAAGAIGAGGLGDLAKREAFRGENKTMIISIILILIIVFVIQYTGDFIAKKIDKR